MSNTNNTDTITNNTITEQHSINVSIDKCKVLYESGNYSLARQLFRTLSPIQGTSSSIGIESQIYLLAMGDYDFYADIDIGGNTPVSPSAINVQNTQSTQGIQNNHQNNQSNQNTHQNNQNNQNTQSEETIDDNLVNRILMIQGTTNSHTMHSEMYARLKNSDPLARIVYALYNVGVCPFDPAKTFPQCFSAAFGKDTRNILKGIKILEDLSSKENDKHSSYLMAKIYLTIDALSSQKYKGNNYIMKAARLGHFDAQSELGALGVNYMNEDQFCDHCDDGWILIPDCVDKVGVSQKIRACVGCGKTHDGSGWILCNLFLCGFKTELNSASIASYASDGFLNALRAFDHPIKLLACLSSVAALVLQTSKNEEVNSYTPYVQGLATVLSTLTLFVKRETSTSSDNTDGGQLSPVSMSPH